MSAIALLSLGAAYGLLNNAAFTGFRAGDFAAVITSAMARFPPFALAAKWAWNKAEGRSTSWRLIIVLALWVTIGLHALSRPPL